MQIKKILFPTNFEHLSLPTVEALYSLKASGLEEIVFLFVVDRDEVAYNLLSGFDKEHSEELKEAARLRFVDWEKEVERQGIRCKHIVEVGNPEAKILEISCKEEVDLIVAGRRRHMAADAVYLSGTTMGVLKRTAIPVMVYRPPKRLDEDELHDPCERVVFTTDFSEASERAFEFLKELKGAMDEVHILHVVTERELKKLSKEGLTAEEAESSRKMEQMADELRSLGLETQTHLLGGNILEQTLAACGDHHATAILMGTTGAHGLLGSWMGSSSLRVAERAEVSVILVPPHRDECYI